MKLADKLKQQFTEVQDSRKEEFLAFVETKAEKAMKEKGEKEFLLFESELRTYGMDWARSLLVSEGFKIEYNENTPDRPYESGNPYLCVSY